MVVERAEQVGPVLDEIYTPESLVLKPDLLGGVISESEARERLKPFDGKSHKEIVRLAQDGDKLASEWLYIYFHDRVALYFFRRVAITAIAADLTSNVMTNVVTRVGNYNPIKTV